jgi:hypothetical protein
MRQKQAKVQRCSVTTLLGRGVNDIDHQAAVA